MEKRGRETHRQREERPKRKVRSAVVSRYQNGSIERLGAYNGRPHTHHCCSSQPLSGEREPRYQHLTSTIQVNNYSRLENTAERTPLVGLHLKALKSRVPSLLTVYSVDHKSPRSEGGCQEWLHDRSVVSEQAVYLVRNLTVRTSASTEWPRHIPEGTRTQRARCVFKRQDKPHLKYQYTGPSGLFLTLFIPRRTLYRYRIRIQDYGVPSANRPRAYIILWSSSRCVHICRCRNR